MYKTFRNIAAVLLIAVMLFCGYQMYLHYMGIPIMNPTTRYRLSFDNILVGGRL